MADAKKPGKFDNIAKKLQEKAQIDPLFKEATYPIGSMEERLERIEAENQVLRKKLLGEAADAPAKEPQGLKEKLRAKLDDAKYGPGKGPSILDDIMLQTQYGTQPKPGKPGFGKE